MSKTVSDTWKKMKSLMAARTGADASILCPTCSTALNRTLMFNSAPKCHVCGAVIQLEDIPPLPDT